MSKSKHAMFVSKHCIPDTSASTDVFRSERPCTDRYEAFRRLLFGGVPEVGNTTCSCLSSEASKVLPISRQATRGCCSCGGLQVCQLSVACQVLTYSTLLVTECQSLCCPKSDDQSSGSLVEMGVVSMNGSDMKPESEQPQ
eukprot:746226-Hanusia_phi.AAC.2